MVAGGDSDDERTNIVEIIDLESSLTSCENLSNFPVSGTKSIGGLSSNSKPVVCGGLDIGIDLISID